MINYNCNEYINNKKTIHKSDSVDRYIVFDEYKQHITLDDFKNYENYYANTPLVQQFKSLFLFKAMHIMNKEPPINIANNKSIFST